MPSRMRSLCSTVTFGARSTPTGLRSLPAVAVTELSVCLIVFVALGAGIAAIPGADSEFAGAAAEEPVRRLAVVGGPATRVAVLTDHACFLHDGIGTEGATVWQPSGNERVTAIAGERTGSRLALGRSDGVILMMDAESLEPVWERQTAERPISSAAFSPGGAVVAIGTDRGVVAALDAATGEELHRAELGGDVRTMSFTPDGARLIVPRVGGELSVLETETWAEIRHVSRTAGRQIGAIAVSRDGSFAATGTDCGDVSIIDLATGRETAHRETGCVPVLSLALSDDGRVFVATADHAIRLLSAADLSDAGRLDGHRFGTRCLIATGDGLLSGGYDGRLVAWNLSTGTGRDVLAR